MKMSKYKNAQRASGDAGEAVALKLIGTCMDCDSDLYNANDDCKYMPGYDLSCSNVNCCSTYQVKTYGPENHGQLTSDYILKQAGSYKVMSETMDETNLRYVVLLYDENNYVIRSVLTDKVKHSDIVRVYGACGEEKCSIKLTNIYDVKYV
jgi:hypothetical protein